MAHLQAAMDVRHAGAAKYDGRAGVALLNRSDMGRDRLQRGIRMMF